MANPQESPGIGPRRSILLLEDDTLVGMGMKAHIEKLGHLFVGQAASAAEAGKMFQESLPDLLLVDIRLDGDDGIEVVKALLKQRPVPAIIVTAFSDPELIARASAVGVFGYLIKPVSMEALAAQIAVAVQRFDEQQRLLQEKQELEQALQDRKDIERAKGIFMTRFNLSEPDAHRRLQQESQKRRIPMGEIARKVIESQDLLGGL